MRYASKQMRQTMNKNDITNLNNLKQSTKAKYKNTLNFMQQWTRDLMQRQNDLQKSKQQFYSKMLLTEPTQHDNKQNRLNIQKLIKDEFCKKIESLYLKHMMMTKMSQEQSKYDGTSSKAYIDDSLNQDQYSYSQTFRSTSFNNYGEHNQTYTKYHDNSSINYH